MIEHLWVFAGNGKTKKLKSGDLAVGVSYQQSGIDSNDKSCCEGEDETTAYEG
jgi:hypothetical protein